MHRHLLLAKNISRCSFWRLRRVIATPFERRSFVQYSTEEREIPISRCFMGGRQFFASTTNQDGTSRNALSRVVNGSLCGWCRARTPLVHVFRRLPLSDHYCLFQVWRPTLDRLLPQPVAGPNVKFGLRSSSTVTTLKAGTTISPSPTGLGIARTAASVSFGVVFVRDITPSHAGTTHRPGGKFMNG